MNDNEKLKKAFQDEIADELSSVDVKRAKKDLVRQFSGAPQFLIQPPIFVAISVCILAFVVFYQTNTAPKPKAPAVEQAPKIEAPVQVVAPKIEKVKVKAVSKQLEKMIRTEIPLDVKVTRVSSDTGSAMVYQKEHRDQPLTVVWVFPKANN